MSAGGRSAGADAQTIETAMRVLSLHECKASLETIMAFEKISQSYFYKLLGIARAHRAAQAEPQDAPAADEPAPEPEILPPRRPSIATMMARIFMAMRTDLRVWSLPPARRDLWTQLVMEIRQHGDEAGTDLKFGRPVDPYGSHAELLGYLSSTTADLDELLKRRLLVKTDDDGLALPPTIGALRSKPRVAKARRGASRPPDPRQRTIPYLIEGGLSDSTVSTQGVESDSTLTGAAPADIGGVRVESSGVVRAAAAAAKDLERIDSQASSSSSKPARDSTRLHSAEESRSTDSTDCSTGSPIAEPAVAAAPDFAAELAAIAGLGRPPNSNDRAVVLGLQADGIASLLIKSTIAAKVATNRAKNPKWRAGSLEYFVPAIRDAVAAGLPARGELPYAAAPSPAAAPLSDDDREIRAMLEPAIDAHRKDSSNAPWPPLLESYKAACAGPETKLLAERWMPAWHAWNDVGRPARLKPPDFRNIGDRQRFAERLDEIEEELTAPDPPPDPSG